MAMSEIALRRKIIDFIARYPDPANCYVGITSDLERRLFREHGVDRAARKGYTHGEATSNAVARRVEQYFINLGCDGEPGGGDEESKFVYAYKKTKDTNP